MVAQADRRLLWHPRLDNKFLVGGSSQITLYEWDSKTSEIKHVTSKHWQESGAVKCMAWSPDPAFDDLVAVGSNAGKVDLLRLHDAKPARSGTSLSSGPSVSLPPRMARPVHALAFCSVDPNYLAVGLDKVRNDASLVIWDVNASLPLLTVKSPTSQLTFNVPLPGAPPRPQPQIPKGELVQRTDPRVLQQLVQGDMVSSVAFLPKSTNLLLAGISHRWLRLFDFRTAAPIVFTAASKVHGIATDPFDQHRIGCYGDGIATIWDARRLSHPLLTFTEKDASADGQRVKTDAVITGIEFSPIRRGVLATLEQGANHVRFWDLQQVEVLDRTPDRSRSRDSTQSTRAPRLSWSTSNMLPWSSGNGGHVSAPPTPIDNQLLSYNLVLSDTRRTKHFDRTLSSFAFVPTGEPCPLTSNVMVVNNQGDLELYAVHDTPIHSPWSPRGDLALGVRRSYTVLPGSQDLEPTPEPWDIPLQSAVPSLRSKHQPAERLDPREDHQMRGRGPVSATFGRGDDDGFPALTAPSSVSSHGTQHRANLAATRPGRAYSPAALRNMFFEAPGAPSRLSGASASPGRLDGAQTMRRKSSSRKSKDASPAWTRSAELTMQHTMEDDISMIMRQRVKRGYGIVNPLHNVAVVEETSIDDTALAQLWEWIHHSQKLLGVSPTTLNGYNFSYQGICGIWEGFRSSRFQVSSQPTPRLAPRGLMLDVAPTPRSNLIREAQETRSRSRQGRRRPGNDPQTDEFAAAVTALMMEAMMERSSWKPAVTTSKLPQRQLMLQLCGWSLGEEDLANAVKQWEKEHNNARAACWLVFTKQYRMAIDVLMRSEDESHHMMSGMLAVLSTGGGTKNTDLREHCARLIVGLHDPYLRAMLTHLTNDEWTEVLEEQALPIRERIAIALQFLSDRELSSYLRRVMERCTRDGNIEGLLFTGLTTHGLALLQAHLDASGDIQSVALLASLNPARTHDARVVRWLAAYRDLLDRWRLFHHRCQFDIDRGRVLAEAVQQGELAPHRWAPPQISLTCHYCNKPLTPPWPNGMQATCCVHCGRPLPRCSICLMTLSIVQDSARNAELAHTHSKDTIDDALVFCQSCRHGGHASHILEWFIGEDGSRAHETCPVASCHCRCIDGS